MKHAVELKIKEFENRRNLIFILSLMVLIFLSVVLNNLHQTELGHEYTTSIKRYLTIGDGREVAYLLNQAQTSSFKSVEYKSDVTSRNLFFPIKNEYFKNKKSFLEAIYTDRLEVPVSFGIQTDKLDKLIFEFNRFSLVKYAFAFWLVIILVTFPQVNYMKRQYVKQFEDLLLLENKSAKSEIAQQVRHNLRTPLSVLMRLSDFSHQEEIKDSKQMLKSTIYQINEIINKLDGEQSVSTVTSEYNQEIYTTLFTSKNDIQLITPKHIDVVFKIDDSINSMSTLHIPTELRSVLSNIVTNSIEAIVDKGSIVIKAQDKNSFLEIILTDNGLGIPEDVLPKVFEKNFSYQKTHGSGIGLSHAKEFIENWGGEISIKSYAGIGTTISIKLPVVDRKSWHLSDLKVSDNSEIFILDDQQLTHELWKLRFKELDVKNKIHYAHSSDEVEKIILQNKEKLESGLFLFDYDLNASKTGLDCLKLLPRAATRCLVTGHFDSPDIQLLCEQEQVKLISKSLISHIPFQFTSCTGSST